MQDHQRSKNQRWHLAHRNRLDNAKINVMDNKAEIFKTLVVSATDIDTVKNLLSNGWQKEKAFVFTKDRNNFKITVDGTTHPIWSVKILPKTDRFDINDWKLQKDMKSLYRLGSTRNKKLYINDQNRQELQFLVDTLDDRGFDLIFDDDYVVLRRNGRVKIFKVAASMTLAEQHDGWYIGQKRIL